MSSLYFCCKIKNIYFYKINALGCGSSINSGRKLKQAEDLRAISKLYVKPKAFSQRIGTKFIMKMVNEF